MEQEKKQESLWWAQAVYYMSDLYYFERIKKMYAEYLVEEYKLTLDDLTNL